MTLIDRSGGEGSPPTPAGFVITPDEAQQIEWAVTFFRILNDDIYHDDDNYYVVRNRLKRRSDASVRETATIINGRTGEVYDRKAKTWLPDPRKTDESEPAQPAAR